MSEVVTINGFDIEVEALHPEKDGLVKFKLQRSWSNVLDFVIPNVTALEWVKNLGGGFWDQNEKKPASNSALRRMIEQGAIRFNGRILQPNAVLNFPLISVIMFPKSEKFYSTLW